MSYYRYRNNRYYRGSRTTPTPRGPRKLFDITSYLKNEFFNADDITFAKIARLYKQLYGYGAYKYLLDTFYSWKLGHVRVSGQTTTRILECVPRFLTDDKRFHILKCEIVHFIDTLHFKQQNKNISLSQLNNSFENYAKEIDSFSQVNLNWFVKKGIFSQTEIDQFLSVCKYALRQKLNLSYRQVQADLALIRTKLSCFKPGTFTANYQLDFLSSKVDLSQLNDTPLTLIQLGSDQIRLDGIFKQFAEQYILEELMKMSFSEKEGEVNHFIKSNDLDFFIGQYYELLDKDSEAALRSEFKGEGGQLTLFLDVKSLKRIQASIVVSSAKLFLYTAILVTGIILVFVFELYKIIALLFFGGLILGGFLLGAINAEFRALRNLTLDLKRYGN